MGSLHLSSSWTAAAATQQGFQLLVRHSRAGVEHAPLPHPHPTSLHASGRIGVYLTRRRAALDRDGAGVIVGLPQLGEALRPGDRVAVHIVQVACNLFQRVQGSLIHPNSEASGRVHAKLDRSPVIIAGSW